MKKKIKVIIIISVVLVLLIATASVIAANYHHIYVFSETKGFFRTPLTIEKADVNGFSQYSLDELRSDERVIFDQSLMLVNTEYMLAEDFVPDVLEYKDTTVYMSRCMLDAYAKLSAAVIEKTGKKLYVSPEHIHP